MFHFDPIYFMFLAPAMLLGMWAQFRVKATYAEASQIPSSRHISGAQVAKAILDRNGMSSVGIEESHGYLSDHYDPKAKVLRLSQDVYHGTSLASLGIAAHEAGHAIQDKEHYPLLKLRNGIVPLASVGSNLSFILLAIGIGMNAFNLVLLGIGLFSAVVFFQLVNLPVEFDASNRAKVLLLNYGFVSPNEQKTVSRVLSAAAWTYVAATLTAVLTLVYYLFRAGLIGGQRREE